MKLHQVRVKRGVASQRRKKTEATGRDLTRQSDRAGRSRTTRDKCSPSCLPPSATAARPPASWDDGRVPRARAPRAVDGGVAGDRRRRSGGPRAHTPCTSLHQINAPRRRRPRTARVAHGAARRASSGIGRGGFGSPARRGPAGGTSYKAGRAGLRQMRVRGAEEAAHDGRLARRLRVSLPSSK